MSSELIINCAVSKKQSLSDFIFRELDFVSQSGLLLFGRSTTCGDPLRDKDTMCFT